jgi:hypothetical protein
MGVDQGYRTSPNKTAPDSHLIAPSQIPAPKVRGMEGMNGIERGFAALAVQGVLVLVASMVALGVIWIEAHLDFGFGWPKSNLGLGMN